MQIFSGPFSRNITRLTQKHVQSNFHEYIITCWQKLQELSANHNLVKGLVIKPINIGMGLKGLILAAIEALLRKYSQINLWKKLSKTVFSWRKVSQENFDYF